MHIQVLQHLTPNAESKVICLQVTQKSKKRRVKRIELSKNGRAHPV